MGLDMYLTAERFYFSDDPKPRIGGIPKGYKPQTVGVQAAYWRKANQIHKWFVDNIQDGEDNCQRSYVGFKDLEKLVEVCKQVKEDPDKAPELLPAQSGFFFGDTDYDEWYFQDLDHTIKTLEPILAKFPPTRWEFYYQASW